MELGSWSGCERVLRYAHPAIDHLRDTAGRIDGALTPHAARPRLVRVAQVIDSDGAETHSNKLRNILIIIYFGSSGLCVG
jgi:hypothetical protein